MATKRKELEDIELAGRKTDYKPEYADQVFKLCLLRATDEEIADFFGIGKATLNRWKKAHPEFRDSIIEGKEKADQNVVNSLYMRATGMKIKKNEVVKLKKGRDNEEYQIVQYEQELPPDPQAIQYRLNNRKSKRRKNKQEISGDPENPIKLQIPNVRLILNQPKNGKSDK